MAANSTEDRLRYQRVSAVACRLLSREGESGRFEFKQTSKAVDSSVLVAAANWVSLELLGPKSPSWRALRRLRIR